MTTSTARTRGLPLALAGLIALLAALVALGVSGGERADAHRSPKAHDRITKQELAFRNEMRRLWEDHITWTRLFIVSAIAELPDLGATAERLLQNQLDLGEAVATFYGDDAGDQLAALLRDHILIAGDLLAAAKAGDSAAVATESDRWYANADDIAAFLADANRAWPYGTLRRMMRTHLDQTLAEVTARLQGDWVADVAAYDEIHLHILEMADVLADGIVRQFPDRFED
jgi:hypothetical protein